GQRPRAPDGHGTRGDPLRGGRGTAHPPPHWYSWYGRGAGGGAVAGGRGRRRRAQPAPRGPRRLRREPDARRAAARDLAHDAGRQAGRAPHPAAEGAVSSGPPFAVGVASMIDPDRIRDIYERTVRAAKAKPTFARATGRSTARLADGFSCTVRSGPHE